MEGSLLLRLSFERRVTRAEKRKMVDELTQECWVYWGKYVFSLVPVSVGEVPFLSQKIKKIAPHGGEMRLLFIPASVMAGMSHAFF